MNFTRLLLPLLSSLFIVLFSISINAQHNNSELPTSINDDGSAPDSSAILDLKSTSKGMLVPRMDSSQRKIIANPAQGLLVFDNNTESFWFFDGAVWQDLSSPSVSVLSDKDGDTRINMEGSGDEDQIKL